MFFYKGNLFFVSNVTQWIRNPFSNLFFYQILSFSFKNSTQNFQKARNKFQKMLIFKIFQISQKLKIALLSGATSFVQSEKLGLGCGTQCKGITTSCNCFCNKNFTFLTNEKLKQHPRKSKNFLWKFKKLNQSGIFKWKRQ